MKVLNQNRMERVYPKVNSITIFYFRLRISTILIPKIGVSNLPLSKNPAITVTKVPSSSNQETSSKGSSSTASNATDSNPLPPLQQQQHAGQKRPDHASNSAANAAAGQPSKKRKLDESHRDISSLSMYTKIPMTNQFNKLEKNDNPVANNAYIMQQLQRHTQQLRQQQQSISNRGNSNESDRPFNPTSGAGGVGSGQRARKYKKEVQLRKSRETFQDIGGMEKTLKELCELLMHIKSPDIYFVLGLMPPRGILLHGPPGCGKTLLAHAIAGVNITVFN